LSAAATCAAAPGCAEAAGADADLFAFEVISLIAGFKPCPAAAGDAFAGAPAADTTISAAAAAARAAAACFSVADTDEESFLGDVSAIAMLNKQQSTRQQQSKRFAPMVFSRMLYTHSTSRKHDQ
jgi:hypothetical protein